MNTTSTFDEVRALVAETLGITDRLDSLDASTRLVGSLPELDSLGVAELVAEIEDKFGFEVDFSDVTIDMFETLGTLASFRRRQPAMTPLGGTLLQVNLASAAGPRFAGGGASRDLAPACSSAGWCHPVG